jgi:hypothetical protein
MNSNAHSENRNAVWTFSMVTSLLWVVLKNADPVPENSLVSTTQAVRKKTCVDKTSSSWKFSAT